jgi:signal transduction histidine kinase/DNA-binding response OmpR family regulator
MMRNNNVIKEVSCKPLSSIFVFAKNRGVDLTKILEGVPYNLPFLLNKHERIEWWVWCKIISNLKSYFNISDFEQMGRAVQNKMSYIEGYIFAFMFFSSSKIAKIARRPLFKAENAILDPMFSCFDKDYEFITKNKIRLSIYLKPGYQQCPEWFYMSKGLWDQIGERVGVKGLKIDLSIVRNGGVYITSWDEEGFFTGLKKQIHWLFNIRKAFIDLTESHEELSKNYNKLEESKKLLQRQTTQLTTAYNISKSIRQNFDIAKTLNTITYTLVNDADLLFSKIKLYKDIEGNSCEIEASNGIMEINAIPIKYPVLLESEEIGELIILPRINQDMTELDELLNYLLPIINVSIHDALVLMAITDYKNNLEMKVDERTSELKVAQNKLSDIIQLQNHFFTNISHEFRTPLTLILGPSKQILEQTNSDKIREEVSLIYRNAKKLNILANQLLDISKIESGKMKLKASEQNVVPIVKRIVYSFQSFAERKNVSVNFSSEQEEIIIYVDGDKIDKILNNILSNAIKFTRQGGYVNVNLFKDKDNIGISVADNGIGISKEHLDKIFDRFYQVDNKLSKEYEGSGIGLSLTKELVELHKGKILVESEEGKGSIFQVILPSGKEHLLQEEIVENVYSAEAGVNVKNTSASMPGEANLLINKNENANFELIENLRKPLLLIIEDNSDVRKYIGNILGPSYRIVEASDGEEGLRKSFEEIPELIISDIMMPKLDGIKLCQLLKSDQRTSHIPVILLTAKVTLDDKIEGLQTGADEYINKPFEAVELKTRISNLIEQRKRIHDHFKKYEVIIEEENIASVDQKFLRKAIELINKHLSDYNFSVEMLAENLAVSRSLLHKKLVVLLGEPPSELIKRIRLNKAARLIEQKYGNIAEIAFEVGFNNPSYFTECFQKQFGFNPSQYHHNSVNNT